MGAVAWEAAASTVWAKNWSGVESLCFAPVRYYSQLSCSILHLWEAPSPSTELLLVCLVSNLERKNTNWHVILEQFSFLVLPHPVSKLHCTEVSVAYSLLQIFRFWLVSMVWNFSVAYYVKFLFFSLVFLCSTYWKEENNQRNVLTQSVVLWPTCFCWFPSHTFFNTHQRANWHKYLVNFQRWTYFLPNLCGNAFNMLWNLCF